MAFTCGFFNSIGHDRKYDATQFNTIFDGLITDGVYQNYMNEFRVSAAEADNTITVDTGRAWFNNTWNLNDPAEDYVLPASDTSKDRIDAVVLEVNTDRTVRDNGIKILSGDPADSPLRPTLTNTSSVHQYPLAYVTRKAGINKIDASNIKNMVGTTECPYSRLLYPYAPTPGESANLDAIGKHIVYDEIANSLDFKADTLLQNGSLLTLGEGSTSTLDNHITYDDMADSLDFKANTLLQNGQPLNLGSGGDVLFRNKSLNGTSLPITLTKEDLKDYKFLVISMEYRPGVFSTHDNPKTFILYNTSYYKEENTYLFDGWVSYVVPASITFNGTGANQTCFYENPDNGLIFTMNLASVGINFRINSKIIDILVTKKFIEAGLLGQCYVMVNPQLEDSGKDFITRTIEVQAVTQQSIYEGISIREVLGYK